MLKINKVLRLADATPVSNKLTVAQMAMRRIQGDKSTENGKQI